ncbi:Sperm flagellar protein 1 [Amphibalanus amphitrite]|uniref:Sperm flagellar protein 1 n=1 Tax=Amphibalanus amphitrite TaxID=1232801 RepID=A0A6A4XCX7_AMPAM|nr:Sperm flagellar protein 1 [Amphibalanus amphitrite]
MQDELERAQFEEVYVWVDDIPLSRPRRNIHRDFSDGCMFAEVVQYFVPRLIELHNYIPANSVKQKRQNWDLLWRKLVIEQTEQIAVLKARCCKLEQLLQLRDDQLRQLGGGEPE